MCYSSLIKNTTREERQKQVDNALSISLLDAGYPSPDAIELASLYIDGKIDLEDIKKEIIKKYLV